MRGLWAIYAREMRGYFTSPIAYVVTTVFLVLVGLFFINAVRNYIAFDSYVRERMLALGQESTPADVHQYLLRRLITTFGAITLFVLPFVTMGSFAEEHRSGTMELLMTSPVGQRQIVLAKFLAASTFFLLLLLLGLGLVSTLFFYGNPHPHSVLVGFLGVFLQGESFLVVGMFISSLTRSQVAAGIGGLGAALLLWLAGLIGDPTSTLGHWLNDLSLVAHFEDFSKGILDTRHVVFHASFIFFGLFITLRSLESLKYR
ncbi:MAG: ABC transporter permease [Candidatus Krumholzibacteriia bacterium]